MKDDEPIDFATRAPVRGSLDVRWIHGSPVPARSTDPLVQVHEYDPHTFILRQSMAVHREAPFMYLFLGNDRALLLDTGATADPIRFPLRRTVDDIIARWLESNPRTSYRLVVAHTHRHYDHVAADDQFAGRPETTVVGKDLDAVRAFFAFTSWPDQVVPFDLGGRVLEVIGAPGHERTAIVVYDPWSGFLVTGDTVYPGRLYVGDAPAFVASLERAVAFTRTHQVTHVMGCHIEMRRSPGRDYPMGSVHQPDEAPLPMTVSQLVAVRDAARHVAERPGVHRFDDFIIFNGPCRTAVARHVARTVCSRLLGR
jgi:glyoxylase-like metal-dependent hydrolase (beta-lactamase superfamily II)